jgi:hypothetical protein
MKGHPCRRSISAFVLLIAPLCVSSVIGAGVSDDRGRGEGRTGSRQ